MNHVTRYRSSKSGRKEDIISDNQEIERENERAGVRNSRSSRRQVENRRTKKESENMMPKWSKIRKKLSSSEHKKTTTGTVTIDRYHLSSVYKEIRPPLPMLSSSVTTA